MVDIEGILEEVVVKVIGHASRKNTFWLISIDRDSSKCIYCISTQVSKTSRLMILSSHK
jgi:hypothetical protein